MTTHNFQLWAYRVLPAICRINARVRSKHKREDEHGTLIYYRTHSSDCIVRWDDGTDEWCSKLDLRTPME